MGAGDASQFTRNRITINNLNVAYLKGGRGAPLVYLHGLSASNRWESHHLALAITNLVYAVQLPGWPELGVRARGRSRSPAPPRGSIPAAIESTHDYAKLIVALLDALKLEAVDLVGHSFGGWIALYLATEYPSRIKRLVLADSLGLDLPEAPAANLAGMDQEGFLHAAFVTTGRVLVPGDFGGAIEDVRLGQEFATQWRSRELIIGLLHGRIADPELTAKLPSIAAESLIVWGRDDRIVPCQHGELLARMIPQARLSLIDGAGHTPMRERRETFQRLVRDFLIGELHVDGSSTVMSTV
jgi:pimeloyl-ACP methyl ester carboxylesterase